MNITGCIEEKKKLAPTPIIVVRSVIADEMRDTERDPAAGGRPAAGGGGLDARRRRGRRVVEALGDELGKLLHPHGYRGDSRARRRASVPTALAAAVAGENRRRGTRRRRRRDATRRPGRHSAANQSAPRMGVMETPRVCLSSLVSRHPSRGLEALRPLPEGWRAFHPSNRRSLAFAPALPPAAGNARAEATPRRWPGIGYTVRRPSYYPLLPSSAEVTPLTLARDRYIYSEAERGRRGYAGN